MCNYNKQLTPKLRQQNQPCMPFGSLLNLTACQVIFGNTSIGLYYSKALGNLPMGKTIEHRKLMTKIFFTESLFLMNCNPRENAMTVS